MAERTQTEDARPDAVVGAVVGIDPGPVTEWIAEHVEAVTPPLSFTLVAGGRSNLTYRVEDADDRAWALRRPPVSHVLPTAHDMGREHRIISALGPTAVPVPTTFGLCTEPEVNGAPFYLMNFVEGHVLRDPRQAARAFDTEGRRTLSWNLVDTLATLHRVDVDEVGLGDLGRRQGYIERQVRRWSEQVRRTGPAGVDPDGLLLSVGVRLSNAIPPQRDTTIVHGDYRLDNVVVGDDGSLRAVLDWEICTLGDPLADLGLLLVYWPEPDEGTPVLGTAAATASGFPGRAEVRQRYAEVSGRDVSDIDYFMAFGYWKLACILLGVYVRYQGGAGAGDTSGVDAFPATLLRLAEAAARALGTS